MRCTLLFSILLLVCSSAWGQSGKSEAAGSDIPGITVARLAAICSNADKVYREEFCFGYIQSLNDLYVSKLTAPNPAYRYCPPEGLTLGDARNVFIAWANENAQYASIAGVGGVFIAFIKAFPCPQEPPPAPASTPTTTVSPAQIRSR